jgi:hypothetical protein
MTKEKMAELMDTEAKELWPVWKPNTAEVAVWVDRLQCFDYDVCKRALRNYYADDTRGYIKPKLSAVIKLCRQYQQQKLPDTERLGTPVLAYTLRRLDTERREFVNPVTGHKQLSRQDGRRFYTTNRQATTDQLMQDAHRKKDQHREIYGGDWQFELAGNDIPF